MINKKVLRMIALPLSMLISFTCALEQSPSRIDITVQFDPASCKSPSVTAELIPPKGNSINPGMEYVGGGAWKGTCDIVHGNYGVVLKAYDGDLFLKGVAEIMTFPGGIADSISINLDKATSKADNAANKIQVNIHPQFSDAIDVTMSGCKRQMNIGQTMDVEASLPLEEGNCICVWYINGAAVDTGSMYTFDGLFESANRLDVTVFSIDGIRGGSASHLVDIFSYVPAPNLPPEIDPVYNATAYEGTQYTLELNAIDRNGDGLLFSVLGLPAGSSFDPVTRIFSWVPDFTQAGEYVAGIRTRDGAASDEEYFSVTVKNRLPTSRNMTVTYTGTLNVNYPDPAFLRAQVVPRGPVSIGPLSAVRVCFNADKAAIDGSSLHYGTFDANCDANGTASVFEVFPHGHYSIGAVVVYEMAETQVIADRANLTVIQYITETLGIYMHGSGSAGNPGTLFIDASAPTGATTKHKDSSSIKFSGGNSWTEVGTWIAQPQVVNGALTNLLPVRTWLGLKNSDDQGTRFDLRVAVKKNNQEIAAAEMYNITGIVRNADQAKGVMLSFAPFSRVQSNGSSDALSISVFTRIGTDGNGNFAGGHSSATGLRFYFDSASRPSGSGVDIERQLID